MVTTDRNSMALNNFKVTQTIALDLLNMFRQDRDLQVFFTKLSFIMYMVRCLFIIEWFSSSGRLPIVSNLKSSFECAISSGVGQNCIFKYVIILSWYMYFVFYINILPNDVLRKMLSKVMLLFPIQYATKNLICHKNFGYCLGSTLIPKIKFIGKYFYFL